MKRSALNFLWSDPAQHGGQGDTMGRPARNANEADRQGWKKADATDGFSRSPKSSGLGRLFGRR